jgi:beta-carotene ketolase (CrtW type)
MTEHYSTLRNQGVISLQDDSGQQELSIAPVDSDDKFLGLAIAGLIITIWAISLWVLLALNPSFIHFPGIIPVILWQTFLYTGLFVIAHDAMHGVIYPAHFKINSLVGTMALLVYGFLPYKKLFKMHGQHHRHPASSLDPDFHNNKHQNVFLWYFYFIWSHGSGWSVLGLVGLYLLTHCFLQIANENLILFWIIPSLLSSFQLFYFGTFLPHREPPQGYTNSFRTQTIERPFLWSLISCYHFGYHYEHHQYPETPWWLLPTLRLRSPEHKLHSKEKR